MGNYLFKTVSIFSAQITLALPQLQDKNSNNRFLSIRRVFLLFSAYQAACLTRRYDFNKTPTIFVIANAFYKSVQPLESIRSHPEAPEAPETMINVCRQPE